MSRLVVKIAQEFRSKAVIVLLIFAAWLVLGVIAIRLGIEDYTTSVYGYNLMPTRKTDPALAWFVGGLPTLIQVAFGAWALEKRSRLATFITLVAFVADVSTDVYYKVSGVETVGTWLYPIAIIETLVLFTLGSEFLLLMAAQNLYEYLPDAIAASLIIMGRVGLALGKVIDWLGGSLDEQQLGEPPRSGRQRR